MGPKNVHTARTRRAISGSKRHAKVGGGASRPRPAGAVAMRGFGPAPKGPGPGPGGLGLGPGRALAHPRPPPVPGVPRSSGLSAVCGQASGAFGLFPSAFLAGPSGPALATMRSGWGLRGPLAARRPAPPAPGGGLRAALGPRRACALAWPCGVFGLRSGARPAGLCGLRMLALGPLRVGPAPVCAARRFPLAPPCGPGLAPRPGSSRPGAVAPGGASCPSPPGVGVGVPPPAGGGNTALHRGVDNIRILTRKKN